MIKIPCFYCALPLGIDDVWMDLETGTAFCEACYVDFFGYRDRPEFALCDACGMPVWDNPIDPHWRGGSTKRIRYCVSCRESEVSNDEISDVIMALADLANEDDDG